MENEECENNNKNKKLAEQLAFARRVVDAINDKSLNKTQMAKKLKMSRPTFYSRISDGLFTEQQKTILINKYL